MSGLQNKFNGAKRHPLSGLNYMIGSCYTIEGSGIDVGFL